MKCKLRLDQETPNPKYWIELPNGKGHVPRNGVEGSDIPPFVPVKKGTIIDHPDAWRLVINGQADPVDDECKAKSPGWDDDFKMTMRQMEHESAERGEEFPLTTEEK